MKKFLFSLLAAILILGLNVHAQVRTQSNHSVSANILGLEYSYEQSLGGSWTIIGRVGAEPIVTSSVLTKNKVEVTTKAKPAITIEPRFYTSLQRRDRLGKNTTNNRANFIMLQLTGAHMLRDVDPFECKAILAYGLRRGGEHWFVEPTFGAGYHSSAGNNMRGGDILPHVQFRFGYSF